MAASTLEADAFKKIYPAEYFDKFVAEGVRPDGRPLGACRPTAVGGGTVSTADGSALAKVGSTTALAGIKLEVGVPGDDAPGEGRLVVAVEMPPMCSPDIRPGRPPESAHSLQVQISNAIASAGVVDPAQLGITRGRSAWVVYLDVYILDSAGSAMDAALLAAMAALADLRIPEAKVDESTGKVVAGAGGGGGRRLALGPIPLGLTCGLYKGKVISDPSAEEEPLMESVVTTVLDSQRRLVALYKPGGGAEASPEVLQQCIETTKMRYTHLASLIEPLRG